MDLGKHRSHQYPWLVRRWRDVAKASGLKLRFLADAGDYKTWYLQSPALKNEGGLYISAGIHGDEPASPEALITWAEQNASRLSSIPCMILPCLNPWGIVNNRRLDEKGRDLNRLFHTRHIPVINAVKSLVKPHRFTISLMLHEDYDGQGVYLYETEREKPFWAEELLKVTELFIPGDKRLSIDGRKCTKPGIVRRKINMKFFKDIGFPEAIHMHLFHSARTFTIETPSEYGLDKRVAAHIAVIEECVKRVMSAR